MRFEVFPRRGILGTRWHWRLRSRNSEIIAHGEAYNNRSDALGAIELVRATGLLTEVKELS